MPRSKSKGRKLVNSLIFKIIDKSSKLLFSIKIKHSFYKNLKKLVL
jgi:hypothetical protein